MRQFELDIFSNDFSLMEDIEKRISINTASTQRVIDSLFGEYCTVIHHEARDEIYYKGKTFEKKYIERRMMK